MINGEERKKHSQAGAWELGKKRGRMQYARTLIIDN
jgi:hypothetical protein